MTHTETAARLFEIVRDMTPTSAAARRSLAALTARLVAGEELDGAAILSGIMAAGAALDPLDVLSRLELDALFRDIAADTRKAAKPAPEKAPYKIGDPIRFRWETGSIEIDPAAVFPCSAAELRRFLDTATIDRAETVSALTAYFENARAAWLERKDKKTAARFTALLEVLAPAPVKKTPVIRAAERVIKEAAREEYQGAFISGGLQCVCDGYRLIRFRSPLPLQEAAGGLDTAKAIGPISAYDKPLELPTAKDLKTLLKIARTNDSNGGDRWTGKIYRAGKRCYLYDFGDGLPAVSVSYLLDMLEALPGCTAAYKTETAAIYFTAESGDGILLPVRKDREAMYHSEKAA